MSTRRKKHNAAIDKARKRWPNQPLIVFESCGDLEILPIGGRLTTFTTHRIAGIINPDGSATVVDSKMETQP